MRLVAQKNIKRRGRSIVGQCRGEYFRTSINKFRNVLEILSTTDFFVCFRVTLAVVIF